MSTSSRPPVIPARHWVRRSGSWPGAVLSWTGRRCNRSIGDRRSARTSTGRPSILQVFSAEALEEGELCERVATELMHGRLVFWFQGRMEWGPRALGNRSLLADPRREDIRELIDTKVKRGSPFDLLLLRSSKTVPVTTSTNEASPFMVFTVRVRHAAKGIIPAVTHVDGTARVQTVTRESNPKFHRLLEAFGRKTGVPVLLNTSFNVQEPIVCSPTEAVDCFLRTQVDWLILGNFMVGRPDERSEP